VGHVVVQQVLAGRAGGGADHVRACVPKEVDMSVRRWLTVVAAVALVFGGCGDEDEAQVFSADELGSVLLAPDDVGPGFAEDERVVAEERPASTPPLDPGMWCEAAGDAGDRLLTLVGDGVAFVEIVSSETARGSFHGVSEQLWSAPVDDAEAFVDQAAAAIAVCAGESWIVEDGEGTASLATLAGEEVGDDSTMVLMTYVTPGRTATTPGRGAPWSPDSAPR
jgi:hypothetical protein